MRSQDLGRVLMIGLDAFEISFAETLMRRGDLPNMQKLFQRSARYQLDHGYDKYSGLAWEHVSSGLSPSEGGRWSAVHFNPQGYMVRQHMTSARPFFADLQVPTVVLDMPYCDLRHAPHALGIVNWGAHDPGTMPMTRPAALAEEALALVGPYPATDSIYGFCWPSVEKTKKLSDELTRALVARTRLAHWMLAEKFPDWKLGIVVVSESHSAIEPLWHGVDPQHPLHHLPSAEPARRGLEAIYREIDTLVGTLMEAFPDATISLFSMHGMGINEADVAAMMVLPELLYRHAFGKPFAREQNWPAYLSDGTPLLPEDSNWEATMEEIVPKLSPQPQNPPGLLAKWFGFRQSPSENVEAPPEGTLSIDWMPASRYRGHWPNMPAFALPSFYDGRIRINLRGREAHGTVSLRNYQQVCDEIGALLKECTNVLTGEPVVTEVIRTAKDPMTIGVSEADLAVIFQSKPLGFIHPKLGKIGPYPWRRTGGHTGDSGFLYLAGTEAGAGDHGTQSSFNVVPTVLDLLGAEASGFSGQSVLRGSDARQEIAVP